ncbi:hypothetical protein BUALT_Bualt05G0098500 [Buddleja alternifolia]|uniref:Protein ACCUMULATION AND REPLICATION OF CHLOROPLASTS 3 n=1 Tax=Buddleja alternifolia TaxID=168488 RepID=A0AAV6XI14_9LAMI|nr:hypothetical protein BUALT_Bualt05G0098500 [Buddleja alternifolia]
MTLLYANTTGPHSLSRASASTLHFLSPHTTRLKQRSKLFLGWDARPPITLKLNCTCTNAGTDNSTDRNNDNSNLMEESEECVEVIAVGSKKDALLDFCFASPFLSPVFRFWNLGYDSEQVQLQQRLNDKDSTPRTLEDFSAWQSPSKAVILVASAAYGSDHLTALEVLSNVKSGNGFVVGIILKPFSFEGQRRQDEAQFLFLFWLRYNSVQNLFTNFEVNDLVGKLQKQANFCIVLDTDTLLENDLVTLDEALRTSNNAVLMAMNAISILLSEKHIKLLNTKDNSTRELKLPEFRQIFQSYNEARVGFGAGYNVKTSLLQATKDCPFLGVDLKDFDGVILCIIASSGVVDCNDANTILRTVRQMTGCCAEIIVSIVDEPNLEPNTILATLIVFGYTRQQLAPRNGIFSSLGQHFPFIFNIFKKQHQQTANSEKVFLSNTPHVPYVTNSPAFGDMPDANALDDTTEGKGVPGSTQPLLDDTDEEFCSLSSSREGEVELLETNSNSSTYELNSEGTLMFKRELATRENLGPGHSTEMSRYGANFSEATGLADNVSIYRLPVGLKHLEKLDDALLTPNTKHGAEWRADDSIKKRHHAGPRVSWSRLTDADFNNNVTSFSKASYTSNSKKQGILSTRAASMLESERDSQKKWSRVVEMKYRGGIYRGRSQGGLPEGKGRLLLEDGSIYDGMWRYGKRSGLGTFYFNNGDVFQGSWRDDVMHGKGWIYFHTGDRWFANFWKGKANGEGRFYSKHGDVFFGHFKEGWRHGHFLRINVDGTRCQELWDEGVLVSEKQLDHDAEFG